MSSGYVNRGLLAAAVLILVVGVVDALVESQLDSALVFALALAVVGVLAVRLVFLRPVVRIRRDHVVWLTERAVDGDEPVAAIVDRAIGAYRAGLTPDDPDTTDG